MEFTKDELGAVVLRVGQLINQYRQLPCYLHYDDMRTVLRDDLLLQIDKLTLPRTHKHVPDLVNALVFLGQLKSKCDSHIIALSTIRDKLTQEHDIDPVLQDIFYIKLNKQSTENSLTTCKDFIALVKPIHISNVVNNTLISFWDYSIPEEVQN